MNATAREFRDFFVSLKLTVVLLVLGMVLVFAATLDQVNLGVWGVQEKYFHAFFVLWRIGDFPVPVFPGGYFIGGLLLINLVAAHLYRFKRGWKKLGIELTHAGLILLLVGELLSGLMQETYTMQLAEGQTLNYSESQQNYELAIVDTTDPKFDDVVAIPDRLLARGDPVQHPRLPFRVVVKGYFPNAALVRRPEKSSAPPSPATMGIGPMVEVTPLPLTYKENERNLPAAFVELIGASGSLGTWLVSPDLGAPQTFTYDGHTWRLTLRPERAYKPFAITLLATQHDVYPGTDIPKNYSSRVRIVTPDSHDDHDVLIYMNNPLRYGGLTFYQYQMDAGHNTSVLQVVRNPSWIVPYIACTMMALGLVIQFGLHLVGFMRRRRVHAAPGDEAIDRSRGAVATPEAAAAPRPPENSAARRFGRMIPAGAVVAALVFVGLTLLPPKNPGAFDFIGFGRLPVLANGRIKPIDTVARSSLLQLQGRQEILAPNVAAPLVSSPTEWLLDVCFRPETADTYPVFAIDHLEQPEVVGLIGRTPENLRIEYASTALKLLAIADMVPKTQRRFSFKELEPHLQAIEEQARLAEPVEGKLRTPFQNSVLQLYSNLRLYVGLKHAFVSPDRPDFLGDLLTLQEKLPASIAAFRAKEAGQPHDEAAVAALLETGERFDTMARASTLLVAPPDSADSDVTHWQTTGAALLETFRDGRVNSSALAYAGLGHAWRKQSAQEFDELLDIFHRTLAKRFGPQLDKARAESRFNAAEPFYTSMNLYALAFFVAVFSWLFWPEALGRAAFALVALAWVLATAGILTRMWLEGRPPVTNLYSSALFIGWGAVGLCLVLEFFFRNGVASVAAGAVGYATLIIAHHLSLGGDTLEMMRAVLDTNLWLATHVVTVVTGYAATFLAGFLALIYIVRGVLTRSLDKATADSLARMVYGIVCFATLFSFVGTVLGGIWADQSWGRFWGWDPKENGALLIVMWNAIILHARWGGMIRHRGLMCLAVAGNIFTSWSWFGTNMLGVGLHSYGFTDAAFWALAIFVVSQAAFILLANLPLEKWRSFAPTRVAAAAPGEAVV
ncbi:MAG TPA: cytochrome c biogenesis protein CcsA [Opitutaceae bacterium]|nr:cytochrome c biogenesis protein CcsA [Opitutaceae bacterium]